MDEYLKKSRSFISKMIQLAKKHKWKSVILSIALIIVFGAVLKGKPETEDVQATVKQVNVIEASALTSDGGMIPVVGTLKASDQVDLRPQIPGQVSRIAVKLNDEVKAGDVLVELAHADLDAQVSQASASLQVAQASLLKMQNGARPEDVIIAEQSVEQAKQALIDMQNGGRPEEVLQAETAVRSAELAVEDAYTNHRQTVKQFELNEKTTLENAQLALQSAQFTADQILDQDLSTVFNEFEDYQLFASLKDPSLESQAFTKRRQVDTQLKQWRASTETLTTNASDLLNALQRGQNESREFMNFLDFTSDVMKEAVPTGTYTEAQISSAISTLHIARASMKGQLDALTASYQSIGSLDISNAKLLESAQTQIDSTEAALSNAKAQLQIIKDGATPEQIAIQQAKVTQAEQQLLIAKNGARPEDLRLQQASVAQARASLAFAVANRDKAIVRAPISGTVTYLPVEMSDIASSSTIVVSLANTSGLEVETYVTEQERAFLAVGNTVVIDNAVNGVIQEIAPALDPVNKKIKVAVVVTDEETNLTLGQSVDMELQKVAPEQTTLQLPLSAVKLQADKAYVFVVNTDSQLEKREVVIGNVTAKSIEIFTEFSSEDQLVLDQRGLKEGEVVNPVK